MIPPTSTDLLQNVGKNLITSRDSRLISPAELMVLQFLIPSFLLVSKIMNRDRMKERYNEGCWIEVAHREGAS